MAWNCSWKKQTTQSFQIKIYGWYEYRKSYCCFICFDSGPATNEKHFLWLFIRSLYYQPLPIWKYPLPTIKHPQNMTIQPIIRDQKKTGRTLNCALRNTVQASSHSSSADCRPPSIQFWFVPQNLTAKLHWIADCT